MRRDNKAGGQDTLLSSTVFLGGRLQRRPNDELILTGVLYTR